MADRPVGRGLCPPPEGAARDGTRALQRKHLRRLERVFGGSGLSVFYLTVCVRDRAAMLASAVVEKILVSAWINAFDTYGWRVGRYVVMPDHVHFFAARGADEAKDLSRFVGGWKNWTQREVRKNAVAKFAWQREFFDHLLRSGESYQEKWEYVRNNAVRARLVSRPEDWPYQGEVCEVRW